MDQDSSSQLPSSSEKLSYKFILDALRDDQKEREEVAPAPVVETTPPEEAHCGREAEVPPPGEAVTETQMTFETLGQEPVIVEEKLELTLPAEKKYFRIGEVSELIGVEPYVLRYWEGEFAAMVRPIKSKTGQRVYAKKDVETLAQIRNLLHVEKFSIKGAKKRLAEMKKQNRPEQNPQVQRRDETLKRLVSELKELIAVAKTDPGM